MVRASVVFAWLLHALLFQHAAVAEAAAEFWAEEGIGFDEWLQKREVEVENVIELINRYLLDEDTVEKGATVFQRTELGIYWVVRERVNMKDLGGKMTEFYRGPDAEMRTTKMLEAMESVELLRNDDEDLQADVPDAERRTKIRAVLGRTHQLLGLLAAEAPSMSQSVASSSTDTEAPSMSQSVPSSSSPTGTEAPSMSQSVASSPTDTEAPSMSQSVASSSTDKAIKGKRGPNFMDYVLPILGALVVVGVIWGVYIKLRTPVQAPLVGEQGIDMAGRLRP